MSLAPLDLIDAHPWRRVTFTTYALSLSFFEAVILDRLVRGGGSQALILADVQGVRASFSEQGAQRVGKDYEVEPVAVVQGVFHPKLTVLWAADECHLIVGSGNLTFGGWGGNCEMLEHLHPSFAADAIVDAADFFERMPTTPRIRQSAGGHCAAIAEDLRRSAEGRTRTGDFRLLHSLSSSISEQVAQLASELGGASRLVAVAPFWDDGAAIDNLCAALGLSDVFVHAHPRGCFEGSLAANWPRHCRSGVHAVAADVVSQDDRHLHAKAFEIICRRGRLVISGSANGTAAALGPERNVEACVARIQRERMTGWNFTAAHPPECQAAIETDQGDEDQSSGVLRAVLEADELAGEVLTPRMSGFVSVYNITETGHELIAETTLSGDGSFRIAAPGLEERSWWGGRLMVRVRSKDGRQADGFVSVASFADITRRAGLLGRRLFALLAGTETPDDVAAIMAWFHEDPDRLATAAASSIRSGVGSASETKVDQIIPVAALNQHRVESAAVTMARAAAAQRNWSRFIDHILLAFRTPRGPFAQSAAGGVGEDDEDQTPENAKAALYDPAIEKALAVFEALFDILTKQGAPARNVMIAFDLTQYVCERLRPDATQARAWMGRLLRALLDAGVPEERRNDVAAAVLTLLAMAAAPDRGALRWARGCLLRLGIDFSDGAPPIEGARGFLAVLPSQSLVETLWPQLRSLRTYQEQVRSYLRALDEGQPSSAYRDLQDAREEWPILERAITSEKARSRVAVVDRPSDTCPRCHIRLAAGEAHKLRAMGVASANGCCGCVIVCPGV